MFLNALTYLFWTTKPRSTRRAPQLNTLKGPGSTGQSGADRIYPSGIIFEFHGAGRINRMFFLFSLSGRKGERESALWRGGLFHTYSSELIGKSAMLLRSVIPLTY